MIRQQLQTVQDSIAKACKESGRSVDEVTLIAVTKTHGVDMINQAIDCGVTDIGENKVQEIMDKYDSVKPVKWHLIGHLQTNKVKYIIDKVCLIHSVDSAKLLDEINRQAEKKNVEVMNVLIEVNASGEASKFGIKPDELSGILEHARTLEHICVKGLMTVAEKLDEFGSNRNTFLKVKELFDSMPHEDNIRPSILSMGMSGDYVEAIKCGATMVRVGSAIFGKRYYDLEG